MESSPLDDDTVEAIGVLQRAVEQVRVHGVLEFRLLANALRRATESRDEAELTEAARVFETLEPEFRVRIMERAEAEAEAHVAAQSQPPSQPESSQPEPSRRPASRPSGSSFLAALNGFRPAPSSGSRNAAKDRLAAAVERQRALVDDAVDVGYGELRPGEPLPRSP